LAYGWAEARAVDAEFIALVWDEPALEGIETVVLKNISHLK
jgi:hypothetical protein